MKTFEVDATIKLTEEDITDIMVTALEGGIGYWACLDNTTPEFEDAPKGEAISETAARILIEGSEIVLIDEEDDYAKYGLTLNKLLAGVKRYVDEGYDQYGAFSPDGNDLGNLDAEGADAVIQLAVFKELVYG
jgi:hypothetical protein